MNTKKILFIGNYKKDYQWSMLEYENMVRRGLSLRKNTNINYKFISPFVIFGHLVNSTRDGKGKILGYIDKYILFSLYLFIAQFFYNQIHFLDHSNSIYRHVVFFRRVTCTCHDVIAIRAAFGQIDGWKVGFLGRILQRLIFSGLHRLHCIACDSGLTLGSIHALIGNKVSTFVCHLPSPFQGNWNFDLTKVSASVQSMKNSKFVLHIGSGHARKNRKFVAAFYKTLQSRTDYADLKCVFVGPQLNASESIFSSNPLEITYFSSLSIDEIKFLYSSAIAFIFPSLHEGFGLPILEAQDCHCPVVCSNIEPLTEVGGKGCLYIYPDIDHVNDAVDTFLRCDTNILKKLGASNAANFREDFLIEKLIAGITNISIEQNHT